MIKYENIGGLHIQYYFFCKRNLWYYLNGISYEKYNEIVNIANVEHSDFYKKEESKKEILIGSIKIDILNKNTVREIKSSSREAEIHKYQVIYYLYYLKKYFNVDFEGELLYPKINKKIKIELNERNTQIIENTIKDIVLISTYNKNIFKPLNQKKCEKCSFYDLCYI